MLMLTVHYGMGRCLKNPVILQLALPSLSWHPCHRSLARSRSWVLPALKQTQHCPFSILPQPKVQGGKVQCSQFGSNKPEFNWHCKFYTYIHFVTHFKIIKNNRHLTRLSLCFKIHVENEENWWHVYTKTFYMVSSFLLWPIIVIFKWLSHHLNSVRGIPPALEPAIPSFHEQNFSHCGFTF